MVLLTDFLLSPVIVQLAGWAAAAAGDDAVMLVLNGAAANVCCNEVNRYDDFRPLLRSGALILQREMRVSDETRSIFLRGNCFPPFFLCNTPETKKNMKVSCVRFLV